MPKISPLVLLMIPKTEKDEEEREGEQETYLSGEEMEEFFAKKPAMDPSVTDESMGLHHQYQLHGPQAKVAESLGISKEELIWAKKFGQQFPGGLDGQGDAARHIALGWLAERSANPQLAHALAALRELADSRESARIDKHNNELGKLVEATTYEEAEEEIKQMLKDGRAKYYGKRYGEE